VLVGARVILACRNVERANAARDDIIQSTGNDDVIVMTLDLASLRSVRQFAEDFNRSALSVYINCECFVSVKLCCCRNRFYFVDRERCHSGSNARTVSGWYGLWSWKTVEDIGASCQVR